MFPASFSAMNLCLKDIFPAPKTHCTQISASSTALSPSRRVANARNAGGDHRAEQLADQFINLSLLPIRLWRATS
jgi:hypothetical protein